MTSATEKLRRLLDERGVEWTYADGTVSFNDGNRWFNAWAYDDDVMCVSMGYLTPEQAIAATLGCDRLATGGILRAEQVREAWCGHLRRDCLYDPPTPDWQAIADELNATLGRGTCKDVGIPGDFACSACGARMFTENSDGHTMCLADKMTIIESPNYCPNCGARVINA